jgi:hypothetical protein
MHAAVACPAVCGLSRKAPADLPAVCHTLVTGLAAKAHEITTVNIDTIIDNAFLIHHFHSLERMPASLKVSSQLESISAKVRDSH